MLQDKNEFNLATAAGVAVREFYTNTGPVDYLLFIDRNPVGIIEAKKAEEGNSDSRAWAVVGRESPPREHDACLQIRLAIVPEMNIPLDIIVTKKSKTMLGIEWKFTDKFNKLYIRNFFIDSEFVDQSIRWWNSFSIVF